LGILASWALFTAAIFVIFKQPVSVSAKTGLGLGFGLPLIPLFLVWVYSKATAGPLVLDCGAHPHRGLLWMQVVMWLCFTYSNVYAINAYPERLDRWGAISMTALSVFLALLAVGAVVVAVSRLQVREHGLWLFWRLLRWKRMESYTWEEDCLLFRVRTGLPFLGRAAVAVPGEIKPPLEGF